MDLPPDASDDLGQRFHVLERRVDVHDAGAEGVPATDNHIRHEDFSGPFEVILDGLVGFNTDEDGRIVFDGAMAVIAVNRSVARSTTSVTSGADFAPRSKDIGVSPSFIQDALAPYHLMRINGLLVLAGANREREVRSRTT